MVGTNSAVTWIGGAGVFLTTVGTAGTAALPEWKVWAILCTIAGGGLTALAFYLAKGKDSTGTTK